MKLSTRIDFKKLRRINQEDTQQALLEYLASSVHNVAATARAFGITRLAADHPWRKPFKGAAGTQSLNTQSDRITGRQQYSREIVAFHPGPV